MASKQNIIIGAAICLSVVALAIGLSLGLPNKEAQPSTLRDAIGDLDLQIGSAINWQKGVNLEDANIQEKYQQTAEQQFSLIVESNMCKPKQIVKNDGSWDLEPCRIMQNWARKNNQKFRGHTLFWPSAGHNPPSVESITDPVELEIWAEDYIKYVAKGLAESGPVYAWDVVNEAISIHDGEFFRDEPGMIWFQIDDILCKTFHWAKESARPETLLFYNDYDHASMTNVRLNQHVKSDKVFQLVKNLTESGCPLDGVGFQTHIDLSWTDEELEGIRQNIQRYRKIGVEVHFTEIDVRCCKTWESLPGKTASCPCQWSAEEAWPESALQRQAEIFRKLLQICIDEENCKNWTVWGYTDAITFLDADSKGLLWDENFEPKLAVNYLLESLKS